MQKDPDQLDQQKSVTVVTARAEGGSVEFQWDPSEKKKLIISLFKKNYSLHNQAR